MTASKTDREYFRRIGLAKAESHEQAKAEHLARTLAQRLERSWALYLAHKDSANTAARHDDPTPFYTRARALGLYIE